MRQRFITFAVFGLILVIIGEWNLKTRKIAPLASLDKNWLEFCIGNAGDSIANPAVTVIRITDDYEPLSIGEDQPAAADGKLSRLDFATILGFVGKLDPKSVAFLPPPAFDESLVLNQTISSRSRMQRCNSPAFSGLPTSPMNRPTRPSRSP